MRKRRTLAAALVLALLLALALTGCGAADTGAAVEACSGVSYLERMGIGFQLKAGDALRADDRLETKQNAAAQLAAAGGTIALSERTEVHFLSVEESPEAELTRGEVFLTGASLRLTARGHTVQLDGTAVLWLYTGSGGVHLLGGTAAADGETLSPGEAVYWTDGGAEKASPAAVSLDSFALAQAAAAAESETLCFTAEELSAVAAARSGERAGVSESDGGEDGFATIEIRCDSILSHKDKLRSGKDAYVPADGVILPAVRVRLNDGDTAFDALQRACDAAGLALEYSWTPVYDSYYVEGINNLYEFDCGEQSGWMYKVNGYFPSYGSSAYVLQPGDALVWCYTCEGLGADIGGGVY